MDVRAENRGRPPPKVGFPGAPVMGRNFSTPGHLGLRVRKVRGESGPKSLCLCCYFCPVRLKIFMHTHPTTRENTLLGCAVYKRGEGAKFLPRPPSSPNIVLWPKVGSGGGAYSVSPWNKGYVHNFGAPLTPIPANTQPKL